MLAAVQFDVQLCLLAKEIEIIIADGMLMTEFVAAEAPVAQPTPQEFFRPSFLFAKLAGAFSVGHECEFTERRCDGKVGFLVRPHPDLLPQEKELCSHIAGFTNDRAAISTAIFSADGKQHILHADRALYNVLL